MTFLPLNVEQSRQYQLSLMRAEMQTAQLRVGRDQYKLDGLEWPWLDAQTWSNMLRVLDNFFVNVTFPDPVTNSRITIQMYPGDRTADPYYLDGGDMPTHYANCKVNLIDCGW